MSDRLSDPKTAAGVGFQNADAEAYERIMGRWSRRLAPLLIRFGGVSDGDRVIDVGCGTGSLTFAIPQIANVAAVTGVDLTAAFVQFARARNADPRVVFETADNVRQAYLSEAPDGPRSFACVALACRGTVPA